MQDKLKHQFACTRLANLGWCQVCGVWDHGNPDALLMGLSTGVKILQRALTVTANPVKVYFLTQQIRSWVHIKDDFSHSSWRSCMSKVYFSLSGTVIVYMCCPGEIMTSTLLFLKSIHPMYKDCLHSIFVAVGDWRLFWGIRGRKCFVCAIQQREVTD